MSHSASLTAYLDACRNGLRAEARLGSPRLRNCAGIGICSIEPVRAPKLRPACGPSIPAFVRLDAPTGRLLLHLESCAISPMLRRRHFADGLLRVADACRLSATLVTDLGLPEEPFYIAPGRYPVLDDGTFLTLSLALAREEALAPTVLSSAA